MNIFEAATRQRLRFNSLSVEQLWTVDYSTLEAMETELTELVDGYGKSTRRSAKSKTVEQERNILRLQIVKHILDTLDSERTSEAERNAAKEHNANIMQLIREKEESDLKAKSLDELRAMLK